MALKLPANFERDLQGKNTNLVPVIALGTFTEDQGDIQNLIETGDLIFLSTASGNLFSSREYIFCLPLLLTMPSLKESVDLESRKYKISNINITISNTIYDGKRFSERVQSGSLMNTECRIFWVSPTVTDVSFFDLPGVNYSDDRYDRAFQVYYGIVRKFKYDNKKAILTLEDASERNLHKDLPLTSLKEADEVPNKYKNKYKPIVYGYVDKSPCVISSSPYSETISSFNNTDTKIYIEDNYEASIKPLSDGGDGLYVYEDDKYIPAPKTSLETEFPEHGTFNTGNQWEHDGANPLIIMTPTSSLVGDSGEIDTDTQSESLDSSIGANKLILYEKVGIKEINPHNEGFQSTYYKTANTKVVNTPSPFFQTGWDVGQGGSLVNEVPTVSGTIFSESQFNDGPEDWDGLTSGTEYFAEVFLDGDNDDIDNAPATGQTQRSMIYISIKTGASVNISNKVDFKANLSIKFTPYTVAEFAQYNWEDWATSPSGGGWGTFQMSLRYGGDTARSGSSTDGVEWATTFITRNIFQGNSNAGETIESVVSNINSPNQIVIWAWSNVGEHVGAIIQIENLSVDHYILVEELHNREFYANVHGRYSQNINTSNSGTTGGFGGAGAQWDPSTDPEAEFSDSVDTSFYSQENPQAWIIVNDILYSLLGSTSSSVLPSDLDRYSNWKYSFTINEKINSKELLQQFSSVTPYLPRFSPLGDFRFGEIIDRFTWDDLKNLNDKIEVSMIDSKEVIDFNYSRTPIENVYTKVSLDYSWDYARGEFNKHVEYDIINLNMYTQMETSDGDSFIDSSIFNYYGHNDSEEIELKIDDERGKYIRNEDTASLFTRWMLRFHANQHLVLKIKLPLKYMFLEVADYIRIDQLIQGIKPFGIDYHYNNDADTASYIGDDNQERLGYNLNGQQIFPCFIVTSTNKTLEYIEIECMQMHNLSNFTTRGSDTIVGCMDQSAWNYNPEATLQSSVLDCYNANSFIVSNSCIWDTWLGSGDEIVDYSLNPSQLELEDENVFLDISQETLGNYENSVEAAKQYWIDNDYPLPSSAFAPKIFSFNQCLWQDMIYHKLIRFEVQSSTIFDGGNRLYFEQADSAAPYEIYIDSLSFVDGQPYFKVDYIMDEEFKESYREWKFAQIKFWLYFDNNNTTNTPTFTQNSIIQTNLVSFDNPQYTYFANGTNVFNDIDFSGDTLEGNSGLFVDATAAINQADAYTIDVDQLDIDGYVFRALYKFKLDITDINPYLYGVENVNEFNQIDFQLRIDFHGNGGPAPNTLPGSGDVNQDGIINILDIVSLTYLALTGEPEEGSNELIFGDVNQDGAINVLDIVMIMNCIIGAGNGCLDGMSWYTEDI